jgi:hypothetical protein
VLRSSFLCGDSNSTVDFGRRRPISLTRFTSGILVPPRSHNGGNFGLERERQSCIDTSVRQAERGEQGLVEWIIQVVQVCIGYWYFVSWVKRRL